MPWSSTTAVAPARLDRLFVQVGGGALATAVVTGLAGAVARGDLARLPSGPCRAAGGQPSRWCGPGTRLASRRCSQQELCWRWAGPVQYFLDRILFAQAAPQGAMDNRLRAKIAEADRIRPE